MEDLEIIETFPAVPKVCISLICLMNYKQASYSYLAFDSGE